MKQLTVQRIAIKDLQDMQELDLVLNTLPKQAIEEVPWPAYPYKPSVQFVMAYQENYLFLKYFVAEKAIRAVSNQVNGIVWEDSCVEFFIAFDEAAYYNLEFNCIGTTLIGFGPSKPNVTSYPPLQ
nr:carbohydrate-binding family 9-like protein [Paraflavitalea speifideiaquila]